MAIRARYKGKGEFFGGIPARDLSEEEYDALTTEQKKLVRESEIYDVRSEAEAKGEATRPASAARKESGEDAGS